MSADRELLELAAKAAGLILHPPGNVRADGARLINLGSAAPGKWWNPLTDDGDALRLAVRLGLTIYCPHKTSVFVGVGECPNQTMERQGNDPEAATRRAIVRAAAEIGRQMQKGGAA